MARSWNWLLSAEEWGPPVERIIRSLRQSGLDLRHV